MHSTILPVSSLIRGLWVELLLASLAFTFAQATADSSSPAGKTGAPRVEIRAEQ